MMLDAVNLHLEAKGIKIQTGIIGTTNFEARHFTAGRGVADQRFA
jgi:hypothetical protein